MDYLDPKKKKQRKNYLMLMYALIGVIIAITTVVLVYFVSGYTIDRETGEVIQNGLLYVDSKPESAQIFLNGKQQRGNTDARLVLGAGNYNVELKRDGYRPWQRSIILEGGSLRRLTYARLVPEQLNSETALSFAAEPTMLTQSIDKRWLVTADAADPLVMHVIDLDRAELRLDELALPLDLLDVKEGGRWEVVDWADDNRTFLAIYRTPTSAEYALIDRQTPANSKKLKTIFASTPFSEVSLRDRKRDLVFLFNKQTGTVYRANASNGDVSVALEGAIDFVSFGNDALLYVTAEGAPEGNVLAILRNGDKTYKLRTLKTSDNYLLDMSKLGNALVLGVGSPAENRVIVYNDPINALKDNDFSDLPVPTTVLQVKDPEELVISADSSVIMARGGQNFASHEFEADRSYNFSFSQTLDAAQEMRWLDGQHAVISAAGKQFMFDFDGSNRYELVASIPLLGSIMERNMDLLFSFQKTAGDTSGTVQFVRSFMRTAADR